ncbi:MAG: hypothetical protein GY720_02440 [bacterium]|nr:hypothetical protein [bacterium]
MRRWLLAGTVGILVMAAAAPALAADEVSADELLADPAAFDGVEVVLEGELIGDYGFRPDGWMWTQLNGDSYGSDPVAAGGALTGGNSGVGIRMPEALGRPLDAPGGYRQVGPIVAVTGQWRFHDPARGGESYLDVASLEVVAAGRAIDDPANGLVMAIGGLMLVLGLASLATLRRSRRSELVRRQPSG